MKSRWEQFVELFSGAFSLSRLVGAAAYFTDQQAANEYVNFFQTHTAPTAERAWKQTAER
jgi:hypothetical protein